MGIDAEVLIRLKGECPSPEQLRDWSFDACTTFGAEKFLINREGRGAFELSSDYRDESKLPDGKIYLQDGPDILAGPDEWLIRARVWTRYYGPGYERGNILFIVALAEWIEQNIPNAEVWYGGDSSGVLAEPFDETARRKMLKHLYSPSGRDYFNQGEESHPSLPSCGLCVPGKHKNQFGWGGGGAYAAYYCPGCGYYFTTRDNGKTWETSNERGKM